MIRPERMTLAEIVCEKNRAAEVMDRLYEKGSVEPEKSGRAADDHITLLTFPDSELNDAQKLLSVFSSAADDAETAHEPFLLSEVLSRARKLCPKAEEILAIRKTLQSLRSEISDARESARCRAWIESLGIPALQCVSSERITVIAGSSDMRWENRADDLFCVRSDPAKGRVFHLMLFSAGGSGQPAQILRDEQFRCIDLHRGADLQELIKKNDEAMTQLASFSPIIPDLAQVRDSLSEYLRIHELFSRNAATRYCAHFLCWIPSTEAKQTAQDLQAEEGGACEIRLLPAETAIGENVFSGEEVPSRLSSSRLFKPFQLIVATYGCPSYMSIDPTLPGALFFLLFFGVMFADIGHGAVIAAIGLLLAVFMRRQTMIDAGKLMIFSGAAASIGGILFGSVFGREDIIHPLLFHPAAQIGSFLFLGTAIGIIVISTGIILNIFARFKKHDYSGAFFSQWGILSLGFYWLCTGILASAFSAGDPALPLYIILPVTVAPLAIMITGEIITGIRKKELDLAELSFRPVEIFLGLLSNTVSFVRIAAFGLCHISLMAAVFIIAQSGPDSESYRLSVSIEGNILVICLEALVVTIQCLRLQFYEFYSKFFGAPGRTFTPLRTPHAREGA
jgi:vacuolar-type H+-ATPase subunit I/STV1